MCAFTHLCCQVGVAIDVCLTRLCCQVGVAIDVCLVLGPLKRCLQETIDYTRDRKAFGRSVLNNQVVHYRLAELETELEALRAMIYKTISEE